jgi:hypothetical protein
LPVEARPPDPTSCRARPGDSAPETSGAPAVRGPRYHVVSVRATDCSGSRARRSCRCRGRAHRR